MSTKKVLVEANEQDLVDVRYHLFPCTQQQAIAKALEVFARLVRSGLLAEVQRAIRQVDIEGNMQPSRNVATLREALAAGAPAGATPAQRPVAAGPALVPAHRPSDLQELHGDELPSDAGSAV